MNTGAYTLGGAYAARMNGRRDVLRTSVELTNLEQTATFSDRPVPPDYYTGRAAPQGFTQRGQVIGAAIGPGSQSQRVAFDYYAPTWQSGLFAERIRWQNDALYRQYLPAPWRHDVSWAIGLRGGMRLPRLDARVELATGTRLNYLFQTGYTGDPTSRQLDYRNVRLAIDLAPRTRPAAPAAPARR